MSSAPARASMGGPAEDHEAIHRGSGDFLADSGVADPDEFRLKAHLCNAIAGIIEDRGLSQSAAAETLGLAQPDVSRIVNSRFDEYSVWRLMKALSNLGSDIAIGIHPPGDGPGVIMAETLAADQDDTVAPVVSR